MLEGRRIVCLSSLFWHGRPSNWYHLARVLAAGNEVLFVDPPRNLLRGAPNHNGRLHPEEPNITRLEPAPHLPLGGPLRYRLTAPVNRRRYEGSVARAIATLGWQRPILWNVAPLDFSVGIAERVPASVHVLHMTDSAWDFARWPSILQAILDRVRPTVDVAIGTTPEICDRLAAAGFVAAHLPHGVDVALFEPVAKGAVAPVPELEALPQPRVGFIGRLDRRLDIDAVEALARGGGSVVLVGPSVLPDRDHARLREAGCHLPGEVPYVSTPQWLAGFDIAVLPYAPIPSVVASRPLKLLEYLAAGLPVVSVDIPAARELGPEVALVPGPQAFADRVHGLWAERASGGRDRSGRLARVEAVRAHSWERRAEEFSDLIELAQDRVGGTHH